jgi:hypothetical protein
VLSEVGQRFGDDEVGGQLDLFGEPSAGQLADDLDRQRSPGSQRLDGGAEAAIGQHGRMDPAHQVAELAERLIELLARLVQ